MKNNQTIIEEFYTQFPTKDQVIKDFDYQGNSTWDFSRYFKSFLLKILEAKDAEIEENVKVAFFAGFERSGEGMNGEYPFQDNNIDPREDERIKKRFDKWKEEKLNQLK